MGKVERFKYLGTILQKVSGFEKIWCTRLGVDGFVHFCTPMYTARHSIFNGRIMFLTPQTQSTEIYILNFVGQ